MLEVRRGNEGLHLPTEDGEKNGKTETDETYRGARRTVRKSREAMRNPRLLCAESSPGVVT